MEVATVEAVMESSYYHKSLAHTVGNFINIAHTHQMLSFSDIMIGEHLSVYSVHCRKSKLCFVMDPKHLQQVLFDQRFYIFFLLKI